MTKFAIRFTDNDFSRVFLMLLEIMSKQGLEYYPKTKPELVALINKSLPGIYWIGSNLGYDRPNWDPASYLKIEERHLYLDEEVDDFISKNGWDNGEFHVLDTTRKINDEPVPYIYSI